MSLLASAAAEPSAVFWRVLGGTKAETNEVAAPARSCSRGGRLAPSPSPGPAWIAAFVEKHLPEIRLNGPCPRSVTSSNGDEDGEYLPGHCQEARGHAAEFNGWAKAIESGCWRPTPIRTRIMVNVVNVVNEKKAMNIMLPLMSSLSQPGRLRRTASLFPSLWPAAEPKQNSGLD